MGQLKAGAAFLQAVRNDPKKRAAVKKALLRLKIAGEAGVYEAITTAIRECRDDLVGKGFDLPKKLTVEDLERLALIVEIPYERVRQGDLTVDEIFALASAWAEREKIRAGYRQVRKTKDRGGNKTNGPSKIDVAITIVARDPGLIDAEVARQAGCSRSYLSRNKQYQNNADMARRALARQQKKAAYDADTRTYHPLDERRPEDLLNC